MMRDFRKLLKPGAVFFLVLVFIVLLILPVKAWVFIGGNKGTGPFGMACYCPCYFDADCFCALPK